MFTIYFTLAGYFLYFMYKRPQTEANKKSSHPVNNCRNLSCCLFKQRPLTGQQTDRRTDRPVEYIVRSWNEITQLEVTPNTVIILPAAVLLMTKTLKVVSRKEAIENIKPARLCLVNGQKIPKLIKLQNVVEAVAEANNSNKVIVK